MRSRLSLLLALWACMSCSTIQSGETVVQYKNRDSLLVSEAPNDGRYALYTSKDLQPLATVELDQGQRIGFREKGGQVVAFAGGRDFPIRADDNHIWKRL